MSVFCLALHADYRCRHAGACCHADWDITVEPEVVRIVEAKGIHPRTPARPVFVQSESGTHLTVGRDANGTCMFFEQHVNGCCTIHRRAGVAALPSACRHFPREILMDARGTFISLSHFCPTAAALLFGPTSLDVVDAQSPLLLDPPLEGMDAVDALAPLVRPGLLCDLAGYTAWERACLETIARDDCAPWTALDLIARATDDIREWRPDDGPLAECVRETFGRTRVESVDSFTRFPRHCASHFPPPSGPVPDAARVWDHLVEPALGAYESAIRNYLGARLFGNWIAYQGRGLRTVVEWLRTALAVFGNELTRRCASSGAAPRYMDVLEAIRAADLLLLHTVDSEVLARTFAALEGPEPA